MPNPMAQERSGGTPLHSPAILAREVVPHPLQIASWSELSTHVEGSPWAERYRSFFDDFGVDATAPEVRGFGARPAILFAEQPGCWLTPRDLVRARLLERIVERGHFDPALSGARSLADDRFTGDGEKGIFLEFHLHEGLGPVRLLGSRFLKRYEHRTYASLRLTAMSYKRIQAIWDYSLQMIEAAAISPQRFAEVVGSIFDGSPVKGARDVLPESNDPQLLLAIGEGLAGYRLEPAFKALWPARAVLVRNIHWDAYWNRLNSEFLSLPVESLSPLLSRFLLAVVDPIRMARSLHEEVDAAPDEPVSVAGMVTADDVFRTVLFDPKRERFFVQERDGRRRDVSWDAVRDSAAQGLGARPSGVLEYLFLAAFGFYLLVDCHDRIQGFHEAVCAIHRRRLGTKFPWASFPVRDELAPGANRFLDIFRPGFVELTVDVLSHFFET